MPRRASEVRHAKKRPEPQEAPAEQMGRQTGQTAFQTAVAPIMKVWSEQKPPPPRSGRRDSERNCISNIRPRGLSYANAAKLLAYLMREAQVLGASGVALKDDSEVDSRLGDGRQGNFLLPPET